MDNKTKVALAGTAMLAVLICGLVMAKPVPTALAQCKDGIDNDGDGNTDYPADAGCSSKNDNDESNCGDGVCEGSKRVEPAARTAVPAALAPTPTEATS
jgi:hypothetical protein